MSVMNALGHGFLEKLYENALVIEFREKQIPFRQQPRFQVFYKQIVIGEYIPDIIIYDKIVIDIKTIDRITNIQAGQMINYLKATNLSTGLILNFKNPKLEWERVVL